MDARREELKAHGYSHGRSSAQASGGTAEPLNAGRLLRTDIEPPRTEQCEMPPLPDALDPLVCALEDTARNAYTTYVLPAEQKAIQTDDTGEIVRIRVLGALLIHSPSPRARDVVAQEILTAASDSQACFERLVDLGEMYMHCFICTFRRHKGLHFNHRTRLSVDFTASLMEGELVNTPHDHLGAKKNALIRDGYRCMLSGIFDSNIFMAHKLVSDDEPDVFVRMTHCTHIMPGSTNDFQPAKKEGEELRARKLGAILDHFGYGEMRQRFEASGTHSLDNLLTLETMPYYLFEELELWLEPVPGQEHAYTVELAEPGLRPALEIRSPVQFKVHDIDIPGCKRPDPKYLPLPNPRYLELHAACCKVANMSGATKYLEKMFSNMEEICALAEDGRSADVLTFAMSRLVAPHVYDSTNAHSECRPLPRD